MAIKMHTGRKIIGIPGTRIMKETIIDPIAGIDPIVGITHEILTKDTILIVEISHKATTKMTIEKITIKMTIVKTTTRRTIEMIIEKKVTRTRDIREKIIMKTSVKMGI